MKTALLIIDIQNDYFPGGRMELHEPLQALENTKEVLHSFREKQWPIIHIQHVSQKEGATFFLPNTEGVKIHSELHPLQSEPVVVKYYPNSFRESNLLKVLKEENITKLIICGMMSHMCVDATVRAACDLGFEVTVLEDTCATLPLTFDDVEVSAEMVHKSFMGALAQMYCPVIKTTDFFKSEVSK